MRRGAGDDAALPTGVPHILAAPRCSLRAPRFLGSNPSHDPQLEARPPPPVQLHQRHRQAAHGGGRPSGPTLGLPRQRRRRRRRRLDDPSTPRTPRTPSTLTLGPAFFLSPSFVSSSSIVNGHVESIMSAWDRGSSDGAAVSAQCPYPSRGKRRFARQHQRCCKARAGLDLGSLPWYGQRGASNVWPSL